MIIEALSLHSGKMSALHSGKMRFCFQYDPWPSQSLFLMLPVIFPFPQPTWVQVQRLELINCFTVLQI